jgi:hypothetical protein
MHQSVAMMVSSVFSRYYGRTSLVRNVGRNQFASFSTASGPLVTTKIDEETGVGFLFLNRPPVNSLSLEM